MPSERSGSILECVETRLHIGTSGYAYRDWVGSFYPSDLPREEWLTHYVRNLDALEFGSTAHRTPSADEAREWSRRLPGTFRLCLTAPALLLRHTRSGRETAIQGLLDAARLLHERAGPIRVQLPQGLSADLDAVAKLLAPFSGLKIAVEPRRDEPLTDALLRMLSARGAALVVTDGGVGLPKLEVTSSLVYLRLREVANESEWEQWAERIALSAARGLEVYAFLRQTRRESAALRAKWLDAKVRQRLRRVEEAAATLV